jgi:hypothetical protein
MLPAPAAVPLPLCAAIVEAAPAVDEDVDDIVDVLLDELPTAEAPEDPVSGRSAIDAASKISPRTSICVSRPG